jgi:muramidase (phage lysozyme)
MYDMLVGGNQYSPLTSMTVGDVLAFQKNMINGTGPTGKHETTAVGKYQIIKKTLAGLVSNGDLALTDIFNSSTQDRAAMALLRGRGLNAYTSGKISKDEFADRVAKEWASMPLASGKGAYDGVGSNKAGGSRAEYLAAFARDGGVFDGPKSGYAATLHGREAVIPLKDGAVPVSMSQEFNMTATNLGELVNIMKNNVDMQANMLAVLDEIRRVQTTTADNTGKMVAYASN